MPENHRIVRAVLLVSSALGALAVIVLVLALLDIIPRSLQIGLASYDVVRLCIAAIVLDMAISTPVQLIARAQRQANRQR